MLLKRQNITLEKTLKETIIYSLSERDNTADICTDSKRKPEADNELRDTEIIPLKEDKNKYFAKEVLSYTPDAWIDDKKIKIGYEIPITKIFYKHQKTRSLEEIEKDIQVIEKEILELLEK